MENKIANRVQNLSGSAIREIFKIIKQPNMISFAGGVPDASLFPTERLAPIAEKLIREEGNVALQYGITEGFDELIDFVSKRMKQQGILKDDEKLIIVTGGQQGIDLTTKVLINEGDGVVVEAPSFIGALNAFKSYGATLYSVDLQKDGMDLRALEKTLQENDCISMVYVIPTFQNPSGITMSLQKREKLLELAQKYDVYILEDNPYGEVRFAGEPVPTIKSLDTEGRVIYCGSFSKILSPGMRVGWVIGNEEIVNKITVVKQVNDVHTNLFAQMLVTRYFQQYDIDEHIKTYSDAFKQKCQKMLAAMDEYMPDYVDYTRPEGGLFLWCALPERYNINEITKLAVERKVAFVPGNAFAVDATAPNSAMRLNYSAMPYDRIEEGIQILSEVIRAY